MITLRKHPMKMVINYKMDNNIIVRLTYFIARLIVYIFLLLYLILNYRPKHDILTTIVMTIVDHYDFVMEF